MTQDIFLCQEKEFVVDERHGFELTDVFHVPIIAADFGLLKAKGHCDQERDK
jgi:hypothetical protein